MKFFLKNVLTRAMSSVPTLSSKIEKVQFLECLEILEREPL